MGILSTFTPDFVQVWALRGRRKQRTMKSANFPVCLLGWDGYHRCVGARQTEDMHKYHSRILSRK